MRLTADTLSLDESASAGIPLVPGHSFLQTPLAQSVSEGESSFRLDSSPTHSFARPPKVPPLPDPSQFPDPYPQRSPYSRMSDRLSSTLPALSSEGSSSASTRSSAYTSSGSALTSSDYGHVHVATGEDEEIGVAVGITSEDVDQMQTKTVTPSSAGRTPIDQTRWSEYSASIRSRSSSIGQNNINTNSVHENGMPRLRENPSFDMGWQTVDERDEVGLTSDEETDDLGDEDDEVDDKEEERTSAVVIAEEGRGLIVTGEGIPIGQLRVDPGTTHLLLGSSSTPGTVPTFLLGVLPQICNTLLALDISANFLNAVPIALASCENLEELNVASNPLRVLPAFLTNLTSLRVLIADSTGIGSLPDSLCVLDKLHTLSVRRNKMHSLPSWLCLLPSLQELYLDGNPFQGPWQALVEPLLAKTSMPPLYPHSTSIIPPSPASLTDPSVGLETDTESEPTSAGPEGPSVSQFDDDTITPARAPFLGRSVTSPPTLPLPKAVPRGLIRTKTAPNGSFFSSKSRPRTEAVDEVRMSKRVEDSGYYTDHDLRRMKSAGELRSSFDQRDSQISPQDSPIVTPALPALPNYSTSASSLNLLTVVGGSPESDRLSVPKRYASLGVSSSSSTLTRSPRPSLPHALFDPPSGTQEPAVPDSSRISAVETISPATSPRRKLARDPPRSSPGYGERNSTARQSQSHSKDREKSGRWGFLKKMSMGKMRPGPDSPGPPYRPTTTHNRTSQPESGIVSASNPTTPFSSTSPQIDLRFSTTEIFGPLTGGAHPIALSPPEPENGTENETPTSEKASPIPPSAMPGSFLIPSSSPAPRSSRRRSFLPVDDTATIPSSSPVPFLECLSGSNDADEPGPSILSRPIPDSDGVEFATRREEERAREAYTRALRSVMAYLKDMNDLSLSQGGNTISMYSGGEECLSSGMSSRRPTIIERANSDTSGMSTISRAGSMSAQLRSPDTMYSLRSGTASQTVSVAASDSSQDERKYKDDKSKRALVVREIVETEKTYVKGLQELVDIYIKPSAAPVNLISGVGSGKETTIPSAERKIVFSGIEALFSFHKESFLPSLEKAAAPLLQKPPGIEDLDPDGQLSVEVATAVAGCFLRYAAFMRMYSTYINNFDNSVQRIRFWSTDRPVAGTASPGPTITPSSSTAQLVGLGLAISSPSVPVVSDPSSPSHTAHLTSGQRKRIKQFLKRCRMNPRHSQLNMEGYLLLPVQRIPRYRLLLEELLRSTPPSYTFLDDSLDRALAEISSLANNMNEGKRESESRRKLVQWQSRIRGKFPSPLVQPHRRLIMDGPLLLTRVVRKTVVSFETFNAQGDASAVQVDCLAPELNPRPLIGILCNDLLVLCRDPSDGKDPMSAVDLWAVLRMQTLPQPASIVHGTVLRLVDNKAILYFDVPTPSDALNWFRAINLHIPSAKA
ncbi:uncharacterized protein EDB93DRAFT_1227060 [Suillus bovinus]|uniref:uncharacterized protein n=1 Tax=Suillus bovinus TaxID=48563 RepID=UPI001B87C0BF|nr:uncharacterized protein EDB93DRAFT_1227060 [Suillus bovinus]KAG2146552.1 hypothetical protein EDB93DRAFT_1227060 [Suillus bovinus]